jgi:hypothetical protein
VQFPDAWCEMGQVRRVQHDPRPSGLIIQFNIIYIMRSIGDTQNRNVRFPLSRNVRFGPVAHSPLIVFTVWEIGHDPAFRDLSTDQLKQNAVATRLGLTTRQVRRLVRQYEQQGPVGPISKPRNRVSNRRLKSDVAEHAFGILRSTYADFGTTLAAEKLRERHTWISRLRPSDL